MRFSRAERTSHVLRRLGLGAHPDLVDSLRGPRAAIAAALDLRAEPAAPPVVDPPPDYETARRGRMLETSLGFWLERMVASPRLIEERMIWFWHDHFATSMRKVQIGYLMWQQHLTLRRHAVANFADLLRAVARDPAMLLFLDGVSNRRGQINENFGREVLELFTIGRGAYSEEDVIASARASSGWVVNVPGRRGASDVLAPWAAVFLPFRHDGGIKTLLGVTGRHTLDDAIDILLDHPATAEHIAVKLHTQLTGLVPRRARAKRLAKRFRDRYEIMDLVEAIVAEPAFLSEEAIRSRVRSPVEKAVGIVQGFPTHDRSPRALFAALHAIGFLPLFPPNVTGFPEGPRLLGPHQMIHTFDLAAVVDPRIGDLDADAVFARLGIHDVSAISREVIATAPDLPSRIALAINSPEYALV